MTHAPSHWRAPALDSSPPESHSSRLSLQGETIRSASRGGNLCLSVPPPSILHCTTHSGARSEGECWSRQEIRRAYHPEIKQEHKKVSGEVVSPTVDSAVRRSSDVNESSEPPREGLAARRTSKKKEARCLKCDRKPLCCVCKGFPFRLPACHAFTHRKMKNKHRSRLRTLSDAAAAFHLSR